YARTIDAEALRQREAFGDACQRTADADLVAQLGHLSGAGVADVRDALGLPHAREDRTRALELLFIAADHDRERRVLCADFAAADGRVEHRPALGRYHPRELLGDDRR